MKTPIRFILIIVITTLLMSVVLDFLIDDIGIPPLLLSFVGLILLILFLKAKNKKQDNNEEN